MNIIQSRWYLSLYQCSWKIITISIYIFIYICIYIYNCYISTSISMSILISTSTSTFISIYLSTTNYVSNIKPGKLSEKVFQGPWCFGLFQITQSTHLGRARCCIPGIPGRGPRKACPQTWALGCCKRASGCECPCCSLGCTVTMRSRLTRPRWWCGKSISQHAGNHQKGLQGKWPKHDSVRNS